jgi:hypothetical protein
MSIKKPPMKEMTKQALDLKTNPIALDTANVAAK